MSKPQITGIKHTDGRSIKLEALLLKNQRSRRYCSADMGSHCRIFPAFWYLSPRSSISKKAFTVPREVGRQTPLVSCRVDGGIQDSVWISMHPTPESQRSVFRQEICGMKTFWLAKWASPQAIELSSLHGGPTGLGRCDGWSVL